MSRLQKDCRRIHLSLRSRRCNNCPCHFDGLRQTLEAPSLSNCNVLVFTLRATHTESCAALLMSKQGDSKSK